MVDIRQETEKDYAEIYNVVKRAFETAEHSDGNEQELVSALRKGGGYIPELSLAAVRDGKIVGYIMFTKIKIGGYEELALAPLAVLPEYQRQRIGAGLINYAHKTAERLGYHYSVVLGSENYYPKLGYLPASRYGIKAPFDVPDKNFMAARLNDSKVDIKGTVRYAEEFGI